eukprot:GHVN01022431.1.p1 GENE.GHVN01022431.1~~GHVN01022431.1.p1  ORF type:complete len:279 (+),score=54.21 GHVN01022431.1:100-936(+)
MAAVAEGYINSLKEDRGGFDFSLVHRNSHLADQGVQWPVTRKTGTTICGVVCADGVVLGADTRATEGPIVADKKADKLHPLADNIYTAGAGTSADLTHTTAMIQSNMELHRLATNTQPRVATVVSQLSQLLYRYQGHVSCALVLGGVDVRGAHLYMVHPHGSTDNLPFAAMGSGSLNAMAVLENGYKDKMTFEEGKALVCEAIKAGIFNDLGSGGDVDLVVIQRNKTQHIRSAMVLNPRIHPTAPPKFAKNTTEFYREKVNEIKKYVVVSDGDIEMSS